MIVKRGRVLFVAEKDGGRRTMPGLRYAATMILPDKTAWSLAIEFSKPPSFILFVPAWIKFPNAFPVRALDGLTSFDLYEGSRRVAMVNL